MFKSKLLLSFKDQFMNGQYTKQKESIQKEQLKIIATFKLIFSIGILCFNIIEETEQVLLAYILLPYTLLWLAIFITTIVPKLTHKIFIFKEPVIFILEIIYAVIYREVFMKKCCIENSSLINSQQLYFLLFFQINQLITISVFDHWVMRSVHLLFHSEYIVLSLSEPTFWIFILQIGLAFTIILYYRSELSKKKKFHQQMIQCENLRGWQYLVDQFLPLQIFVVSYSNELRKSSQQKLISSKNSHYHTPLEKDQIYQHTPPHKQMNQRLDNCSTNMTSSAKNMKKKNIIQQSSKMKNKYRNSIISHNPTDFQQDDDSQKNIIKMEDLEIAFCNKNCMQMFNLTEKQELVDIAQHMYFPSNTQHQSVSNNVMKQQSPDAKQIDPQTINTPTNMLFNRTTTSQNTQNDQGSCISQGFYPRNLIEKLQQDLYPLFQNEAQQNQQGVSEDNQDQNEFDQEPNSINQFNSIESIYLQQAFQKYEFIKSNKLNCERSFNGDTYCNVKYCQPDKKNRSFDIRIMKCIWQKKSSFIVIMTDISKKEQIQRMKEVDKFKDKVIDSITHNLKTPLNGILLSCQTLQMNLKQHENLEILDHIYQNSFILLNMINDILDYSRFLKDQLKLEMKEHHMSSILDEVYAIMKVQFDVKKLQFCIKDYTMNATINTDKNRLIQVLLQFLSNSIKFTQKGYVKLKVFLYQNAFKFTIEDTGQGMSKQLIERLGNLFMQPHKSYQHVGENFFTIFYFYHLIFQSQQSQEEIK